MSRHRTGWCTLLALGLGIAGAAPAGAQAGSLPGARPDGRLLRPAVDSIIFVVRSADRTDTVGRAFQSLESIAGRRGNEWLQVYISFESDGSTAVDSLVMDSRTLRPLRESRHNALGVLHLTYSASGARGLIEPSDGSPRMVDTTFTAPVFASASVDAVVSALPLDSGYTSQMDLYYPFPAPFGVRRVEASVVGSEWVRDQSGREVECWVVNVTMPGTPTRSWIDKASRRLVQTADRDDILILFRDVSGPEPGQRSPARNRRPPPAERKP